MRRTIAIVVMLVAMLLAPASAAGASVHHEGTWELDDGTVVTLSKTSGFAPLAGGTWNAGCQYSATNVLGNVIYSFTIWQKFASNGTKITVLFNETTSSFSDLGGALHRAQARTAGITLSTLPRGHAATTSSRRQSAVCRTAPPRAGLRSM